MKQNRSFLLKVFNITPSTKNFLLLNPFISLENKDQLVGNIFLDNGMYSEKDSFINRLKVNGLSKIKLFHFNGSETEPKEEIFALQA
jgi:hypothetical protein